MVAMIWVKDDGGLNPSGDSEEELGDSRSIHKMKIHGTWGSFSVDPKYLNSSNMRHHFTTVLHTIADAIGILPPRPPPQASCAQI